jgi:outer membrane receptor for ferrienterochelin and colicins
MGGVVNIITRSPDSAAFGATAMLFAGTQGRLDGAAGIVAGRGSLSGSLDVSRRVTETTPGRAAEGGALAARTDLAAKLRWAHDTTISLEAAVLALDERQRWRTGSFYDFGDNQQVSGRVGATWTRGRHRIAPTVFASVFDHLSRGSTEPQPIAGDTGQRQLQRVFQAEVLYSTSLGSRAVHALDLGVQVKHDDTESGRVRGGVRSATSVEPFAQLELVPSPNVSILPGIRVSHNSRWGTHTTPRVATRFRVSDGLTLRASAGTGFRAPDFKELYMFFQNTAAGYAVIGSEDLRPESSRNVTGGAEWSGDRAYLRGQLFWNGYRNFIETRAITPPGEPPVFQYANIGNGWTRGVDIETGVSIRSFRVESGYSGLATRDEATGQSLLGRPSHSGRATLGYALPGGTRASVSGIHTGRTPMLRDEVTGAVTSWRDAYGRVDVRLAHRLPGGFELVGGADNLFDRRPAEWAGFTGRHLYTALSWALDREDNQ